MFSVDYLIRKIKSDSLIDPETGIKYRKSSPLEGITFDQIEVVRVEEGDGNYHNDVILYPKKE